MLFAKLAAVSTFAVSVFAAPIAVGVNTNQVLAPVTDTVSGILQDLQIAVNPLVVEINDLTVHGVENVSGESVTSLLTAVTAAVDTANTAISHIGVAVDVNVKRVVAVDEVAKLLAYILTDVITAVETLKGAPLVEDLLPGIDGTLRNLVGGVNTVLSGVAYIVGPLLDGVMTVAQDLGYWDSALLVHV